MSDASRLPHAPSANGDGRVDPAVAQSERRLRAVYERAPVGICETDPDGRFLRVNPRFCEITGYTADDLRDRTFADITHPDDRDADLGLYRRLLAGELPSYTLEKRYLTRDGHPFWANVTCSLVRGDDGRPLYGIQVVQDTSVRRLAEEALRDNQRRLRAERARLEAVLRQMPAGVLMAEAPSGRIVYANARAEELLGEPFPRRADSPLSGADGRTDATRLLLAARALAGETVTGEEVGLTRPDGSHVWLSVNAGPIRDPRGEIVAAVVAFEDVTARKRAEEDLRDANRRKDEFLAMLGHELRNPLAPVSNMLEVLRLRGRDPAAVSWAVEVGRRQVDHLRRLVDDLLDVSRISRGKVRLQCRRLDLAALVRATVEDHRHALEGHGLTLEAHVAGQPAWVNGDATRLAQVLGNLLVNAGKFTEPGGRVTVEMTVDRGHQHAVVRVRDTGVGIAPELLPRLFDPFAQGDNGIDRDRGGLGLGLALVKGLVGLHGGGVSGHSDGPGKGAEFSFWLPLAEPGDLAPPACDGEAPAHDGQLRILVVEDNEDAGESLRVLLELRGHKVSLVGTGPAGVAAAKGWRPDLVISDIGLPGLDGFGVARALRADPATAGIKLVAVSGYGQDEDRQRCRDAGFDAFLVKPVEWPELERILAGTRRAEAGATV